MDEEIKNTMPERVKNLPKALQDVIFDGAWEERTSEIAKKYSLNDSQADSLINNVLYILIGTNNPDVFLETIVTELGISRLLAEQMIEDLEIRVFEYVVKIIEGKETKIPEQTIIQKTILDAKKDIPEIRPNITPMVEKGGKVQIESVSGSQNIPAATSGQTISVPRYLGTSIEKEIKPVETKPATNAQPTPIPIPKPTLPSEPSKNPELVTPAPKSYTVDPYREPIE